MFRRSVLLAALAFAAGACAYPPPPVVTAPAPGEPGDSVVVPPPVAVQPPARPRAPRRSEAELRPPAVEREFRAAWIATVGNIDWPSKPGLTTAQQQAELLAILDRAKELHLNAVIFQVRPAGDALYASSIEPWSQYLTGEMGRAPDPFYDPLEFAIEAAHARGLELHAWFNPYRARLTPSYDGIAGSHIARQAPQAVHRYGSFLWMDPGERVVRERALRVIADVVRRYDVDGVHIDDYFYPYLERDRRGRLIDFPDDASWKRYVQFGGRLARDDWRRANVNQFVQAMYDTVKAEKPWVKVGISPFGIWRPGYPTGVTGLDAYRELYADARKWLNEGWLDYITPQLYFPAAAPRQPYDALLHWWVGENTHHREVWPGNFTSRVGDPQAQWWPEEILTQIRLTRDDPGATGNVHFSMRALMENRRGLADSLVLGPYAAPALVPAMPWLGMATPARPAAAVVEEGSGARVELAPGDTTALSHWVVRALVHGVWSTHIVPSAWRDVALRGVPERVVVNAVSRTGIESGDVVLDMDAAAGGRAEARTGQER